MDRSGPGEDESEVHQEMLWSSYLLSPGWNDTWTRVLQCWCNHISSVPHPLCSFAARQQWCRVDHFYSAHSSKREFLDDANVVKYNLSLGQLYVFPGVTRRRIRCAVFIMEAISTEAQMFIAEFTAAHFKLFCNLNGTNLITQQKLSSDAVTWDSGFHSVQDQPPALENSHRC